MIDLFKAFRARKIMTRQRDDGEPNQKATAKPMGRMTAKVTRADGSVEHYDLGSVELEADGGSIAGRMEG